MSYPSASEILASACAGLFGRIVAHPFDTVKSKLQSGRNVHKASQKHPLIGTIKMTYGLEGFRGFYKGLGACLVGGIPGVVVYLTSYEASRAYLGSLSMFQGSSFSVYFLSGMIAEASSCIIFVPVDVIKERLQVQQHKSLEPSPNTGYYYRGSWDAAKKIVHFEGLRGIYKGYFATLAAYGPFSAFYFFFYEHLKTRTLAHLNTANNHNNKTKTENLEQTLPFGWALLASASAGAAASLITNPLDMIKLRLQIERGVAAAAAVQGHNSQPLSVSSPVQPPPRHYRTVGWIETGLSSRRSSWVVSGCYSSSTLSCSFHCCYNGII